jgi:3-hydroxyisobutyrate dehydrogenase-like beta-hydroxyacid dehydrogenase
MSGESIGFVGAGLMGHGIATNILRGGYPLVTIAHRSRGRIDDLIGRGATEAASLAELGERATMVFLCVPGSPQVEATVAGLAEGLRPGSVIVDCSTSDPGSTAALAERLAGRGVEMADAPLGGTPVQAAEGKLSAMIGATDAVFARIRPVVETWAATIRHIGGPGAGHQMKLINNFLSLGYAAIYAEALTLGARVGLPPQTIDSVIRGSRMDCGFYQTFMGYIIDGNPRAHEFTLTNALKDLTYLESMANAAGVPNPVGNAAKNSFSQAVAADGGGPEDFVPHLVRFVGARSGVRLEP